VDAALAELPAWAAWHHLGAREGFEVAFLRTSPAGVVLEGSTSAVEDGAPWVVGYRVDVDPEWRSRKAEVWSLSAAGRAHVALEARGGGSWLVDGEARPDLDGALDVDLEASVLTNTLAVHRLELHRNEVVHAPAAYVRAGDLSVVRLDQLYQRRTGLGHGDELWTAHYESPDDGFTAELRFDRSGLVVDYPGLARRTA